METIILEDGSKVTCIQDNAVPKYMPLSIFVDAHGNSMENPEAHDCVPSSVSVFLLEKNGIRILFDSGYGASESCLPSVLAEMGISSDEIDFVFITHMHGDHIGGMTKDGKAAFARAEVYVSRKEHDFWMSMTPDKNMKQRDFISSYEGRIHLFDNNAVLPGNVESIPAPGHTPGHTIFRSGNLLVVGDILHGAEVQLRNPDICATYDINKEAAVSSRRNVLEYASEHRLTMAGVHFPVPSFSLPITVAIKCLAFNQEPYIRKCLEGFVMQKTSFRFVAIVHDDASTDGTAEIIREYAQKYPEIIIPILETENQYSKKDRSLSRIVNKALSETGCKYIAWCEGDDFWTDEYKLQKQVDVLEAHPEYSMCCTNMMRFVQAKGQYKKKIRSLYKDHTISLNYLLYKRNKIATVTAMCRTELMKKYWNLTVSFPVWGMGDLPTWLYMARHGDVCKLKDFTAVYRMLPESASHSRNRNYKFFFRLAKLEIPIYFCRMYGKPEFLIWVKRFLLVLRTVISHPRQHKDKLQYLFKARYRINPE